MRLLILAIPVLLAGGGASAQVKETVTPSPIADGSRTWRAVDDVELLVRQGRRPEAEAAADRIDTDCGEVDCGAVRLVARAVILNETGSYRQALPLLDEAGPRLERAGSEEGSIRVLLGQGAARRELGEYWAVLPLVEVAMERAKRARHHLLVARALRQVGVAWSDLGEKRKALEFLEQALLTRRTLGDRSDEADTLQSIATVRYGLGEKRKALEFYEEALPVWRALGDRIGEASTLNNIGAIWSDLGEQRKALEFYEQALPMWRALGDRSGEAGTLINTGRAWYALGDMRTAWTFFAANSRDEAVRFRYADDKDELQQLDSVMETFSRSVFIHHNVGSRPGEAITKSKATRCTLVECQECGKDDDCSAGFACRSNRCVPRPECSFNDDCGTGKMCQAGRCVKGGPPGVDEPIRFAAGKASLSKSVKSFLQDVARSLRDSSQVRLLIAGHASRGGSAASGRALGQQRADAVKAYLVVIGVDPARLTTVSYGVDQPICAEANATCRARNDRVELTVDSAQPPDPGGGPITVERYPTVDAPGALRPGEEGEVEVSLTVKRIETETPTEHVSGEVTPEGAAVLQLPVPVVDPSTGREKPWPVDVRLQAPGLDVIGARKATVLLRRIGDSDSARFKIKARKGRLGTAEVFVSFWHEDQFLAKVVKRIEVTTGTVGRQADPERALGQLAAVGPEVASARGEVGREPFDATLIIRKTRWSSGQVDLSYTLIPRWSLGIREASAEKAVDGKLLDGLGERLGRVAAGRGLVDETGQGTARAAPDELLSIGLELRQRVAGKDLVEALANVRQRWNQQQAERRAAGQPVDEAPTLKLLTADPDVPWELVRVGGPGMEEFLGVTWRIARWHLDAGEGSQGDRPPAERLQRRLIAVAPRYAGDRVLPAQAAEIKDLQRIAGAGFRAAPGSYDGLRELLAAEDGVPGVIHFAGHGAVVHRESNTPSYQLDLEDGKLVAENLPAIARGWPRGRPLVVLNACDVGEARRAGGRVQGWAPRVLDAGAAGFVGGLWPLGDRAAADFAVRFYQLVFDGVPVDEAVRRLRRRFAETGDPTYLAYVYYGVPGLALRGQ